MMVEVTAPIPVESSLFSAGSGKDSCGKEAASVAKAGISTAVQSDNNDSITLVHVPHVRQAFNWDCGLACALMVLQTFGLHRYTLEILRSLCDTTSVWTVDLAYLLRRCGLNLSFYTITLGANPDYVNERFYAESLEEDEARVQQLFKDAQAAGIAIEQRSLSQENLKQLLCTGKNLLIMLVDKAKLSWSWVDASEGSPVTTLDFGYTGHYVVVYGYDHASDEFMVQDPASSVDCISVSGAVLERARRSFGTDEDLLVVHL